MKRSGSFCLALVLAIMTPALLSLPAEAQSSGTSSMRRTYSKRKMAKKTRLSTKEQCQSLLSQNTTDSQLLTRYDKLKCDQVLAAR